METHFWRRHSAGQTRGAPAAPAPRPRRRPGASGSTATAVVTASPHSPRHHRLCPWTREARAGPRGAPGRQALSVPMLLPRQGARGPRPDRLAPTVWPWPQSPHFAVARSPRLQDRAKAGGEVMPGARGASRTGGRGRHQRPPTPSADSRPSPRPCRLFSWWQRPHSAGTRKGTPVPHACAARGRRSGGSPGLLGEGPRARVCGQKLSKGKRGHRIGQEQSCQAGGHRLGYASARRQSPALCAEGTHGPLSFGLLPEPPRVIGERRRVMPRNPLRMRGDPGHPSAWPRWLEPHLDTARG